MTGRKALALLASMFALAGCSNDRELSDDGRAALEPTTISGGGTTGIYYAYGGELASVLESELDVHASVLETGGSIENLRNLASGASTIAFSAADAAADATAGRGSFDEPVPVRAVARVYDDFVHLIVPLESDINSITDLKGHAVSLGAGGSGTELIARRLLDVAQIDAADLSVHMFGINKSIEGLRNGDIDAFFWSGGLPTPGIDDLAAEWAIRLVPLNDLVETMRAEYGGGYRHGVVPEGTYGLPVDVQTMAVPNFLMVREDLADDAAYMITKTLFDRRANLAEQVPAAALLDRPRAIFTEPVKLHPGALRYYRDTKI